MDTVSLNVSGQVFKVSRAVLKKHSRYFDDRLVDIRSDRAVEDLSGVQADAFEILKNYMTKSELNLADASSRLLSSVQDAACFLGLTTFQRDLEQALKSTWCRMKDLNAVLNVAARLGVHGAVVRAVVEDVLKVLLGDKDKGVLQESNMTYEILIFVARLGTFWEVLMSKCKYSFSYEAFFESVVNWVAKTSAAEATLDALVSALNIHTVPWKYLADCVSNAAGLPEMKELLKFSMQKRQEEIRLSLNQRVGQFRLVWYDGKQSSVVVQEYNGDKFGWDEKITFSRIPLVTEQCVLTKDYVYALGDQTLTSVRLLGSSPLKVKFPERLEITHCFAHRNNLFCFGWNKRDHVVYEYIPERREFVYRGISPVDSNMAAVSLGDNLYVVGERLREEFRTHRMTVWMFDYAKETFTWIADLRKSWCIPEQLDDTDNRETGSNPKAHLVPSGDTMYALVQERQPGSQSGLYAFRFSLIAANRSELEPCKLTMPILLDRHSCLTCARDCDDEVLLLFRSATRGEYHLAVFDQNRIYQLGFLPSLPSGQCVSLEHAYLRSRVEKCEEAEDCPSPSINSSTNQSYNTAMSMNTSIRSNSTRLPARSISESLGKAPTGSETTLVKDETDLERMRNQEAPKAEVNGEKYSLPRVENLQNSMDSNQSYGNMSRASSRRSISSAFSRTSSMRSSKKDGKKKKGFGSKALSVMAGLVS